MQELRIIERRHVDTLNYSSIQLVAIEHDGALVREMSAQSSDQSIDKLMQTYRGIFTESLKMENYKISKN